VGFYFYADNYLTEKKIIDKELIISIPPGSSLNKCVDILNNDGLFKPNWFFKIYIRFYSKLNHVQIIAGIYRFSSEMDNRMILNSLFSGKNLYLVKVTYPEGITLMKFAEITENHFNISSKGFLDYVNSPEILQKYGINATTAEGYLMPDTYTFQRDASIEAIAEKLLHEQQKIWVKYFKSESGRSKFTKHEILTLASIIEAETPVSEERPRVSGVYQNRLKKNMLLQADPTVAYIFQDKKNLTYSDLKTVNRYNTYIFHGLPPGPINSPSLSSIKAAMEPEEHNYLYFVAIGDSSRRHKFSENYRQHLLYVLEYRKNLRKKNKVIP